MPVNERDYMHERPTEELPPDESPTKEHPVLDPRPSGWELTPRGQRWLEYAILGFAFVGFMTWVPVFLQKILILLLVGWVVFAMFVRPRREARRDVR